MVVGKQVGAGQADVGFVGGQVGDGQADLGELMDRLEMDMQIFGSYLNRQGGDEQADMGLVGQ